MEDKVKEDQWSWSMPCVENYRGWSVTKKEFPREWERTGDSEENSERDLLPMSAKARPFQPTTLIYTSFPRDQNLEEPYWAVNNPRGKDRDISIKPVCVCEWIDGDR